MLVAIWNGQLWSNIRKNVLVKLIIYKIRCIFYFINEVINIIIFKSEKKFDNKKYIKYL